MTINTDADAVDKSLQSGQIDAEPEGTGVQSSFQAQINSNPQLKKYSDDPVTGFTRYFAVAQTFATGTDGCGIVTFALTLERMAHAFSRLESLPGGARVAGAMRARPDLVGGPDGADYLLMRGAPGWLAKGGAEGLLCAAGPNGTGVALKTEDGASRAHAPALAAFLGQLGVDLPDLAVRPVLNTRGEQVGELALTSSLRIAES